MCDKLVLIECDKLTKCNQHDNKSAHTINMINFESQIIFSWQR